MPLLKQVNMEPIFKNYRPVSNLKYISKLIERVVALQLNEHLMKNDILESMQSAYKNDILESMQSAYKNDILESMQSAYKNDILESMQSAYKTDILEPMQCNLHIKMIY